jgi:predicted MFS family arabinose efflux permease
MAAALLLADRHGGGAPARQAARTDWLGVVLLAVFMTALIFGLHALPDRASAPWAAIAPLVVAALALAGLLRFEARSKEPLLDLAFFARGNFTLATGVQFVSMFNIMTLLLYYNLFAQSAQGLAFSAIEAGLSLLPLSLALFWVARAAPRLAARFGLARVMAAGMLLTALGCAVVGIAVAGAGKAMLALGLLVIGAGIALPYASGPRLGLAALPADAAGQASGILNSCSFLGGTVGVTAGGIALGIAGFPGVLAVIALSALIGAGLCLGIDRAESALQP